MENKNQRGEDFYKEGLSDFIKSNPNLKSFNPFMENTKWTDEEGNKFSMWRIGDNLVTGDGGAELFIKAMNDLGKQYTQEDGK